MGTGTKYHIVYPEGEVVWEEEPRTRRDKPGTTFTSVFEWLEQGDPIVDLFDFGFELTDIKQEDVEEPLETPMTQEELAEELQRRLGQIRDQEDDGKATQAAERPQKTMTQERMAEVMERRLKQLRATGQISFDPRMLDAEFQFSDDPGTFSGEFGLVRLMFADAKGEDPRVDFLAMRALFHAGRMLERLKAKGEKHSNKPSRTGSVPNKGYVTYEEVIQEAEKASQGVSQSNRARIARKRLLENEAKSESPRDVYSIRHIIRILSDKQ